VPGLSAYVLQKNNRNPQDAQVVAIAWDELDTARTITLGGSVTSYDFMGNPLPAGKMLLGATPVYLVSHSQEAIVLALTDL